MGHRKAVSLCCVMAVIGVNRDEPGKRRSATTESRARRCLFGRPTDPEQTDTMSDWQAHERIINEEKTRRWNFDFERQQPLPGRWQWERVSRPGCQQTPPGHPSDDATPTATASPSADEAAPPPVSRDSTTSTVELPSPAETPTCSTVEPRRKRRRQTTLPGTVILCRIEYVNIVKTDNARLPNSVQTRTFTYCKNQTWYLNIDDIKRRNTFIDRSLSVCTFQTRSK